MASEMTNSEEVAVKNARSAVTSDTPRRPGELARLRERMRDPEWRRYGYLLLGGKALGIPAYPEYRLHGSAAPQGTPAFTEQAYPTPRVAEFAKS